MLEMEWVEKMIAEWIWVMMKRERRLWRTLKETKTIRRRRVVAAPNRILSTVDFVEGKL